MSEPAQDQPLPPAMPPEIDKPGLFDLEVDVKGQIASVWLRFGVERRGKIDRGNLMFQVSQGMTPIQVADALRQAADIAERKINAETLDAMDAAGKTKDIEQTPHQTVQ